MVSSARSLHCAFYAENIKKHSLMVEQTGEMGLAGSGSAGRAGVDLRHGERICVLNDGGMRREAPVDGG